MTTEDKGGGIAQEDETQTEDVQESRNQPENAEADAGEGDESQEPGPKEEGGEDEGDGEGDGSKPDPDNRPKSPEARRRARDRATIDGLEADNRRLQDKIERITKAGDADAAPKAEDYDDDIALAAAQAVWKQSNAQSKRELDELNAEVKSNTDRIAQERQQAFAEQCDEARTRHKDFDGAIRHLPSLLSGNEAVAEAILDSDMGADIAYFLGNNPARAREIAAMNPRNAWKAIGALETRLSQPGKAPKRADVPEPVEPVRGGGGGVKPSPYTAKSTAEYMRMMDKKELSSAS